MLRNLFHRRENAREINEFQPDAIAIRNERLPLWLRYSALFSALFVLALILWACLCKVDVVVQAPGRLVANEYNIVMKPLERSVIKTIHVKIGEIVKKDQVLVTFDDAIDRAEAERLNSELSILAAQHRRLLAEFNGEPFTADDGATGARQLALFRQRSEFFREKCNYYDEEIKQLDAVRKAREESLHNQLQRLDVIKQIEEMFRKLYESRAGSLKELLSVNISRMEMEAAVDDQRNQILELTHQRESALSSKQTFIQDWKSSVSEELIRVERELVATRKACDKVKRMLDYIELRAPCDSVVHELAAFSIGSAVREAEALVTLIPLDGRIELEAELPPNDIGKVAIGSEVRIKLNAYPFQKHGTLSGYVRNISENTLEKQSYMAAAYYRVRIPVSGRLKGIGREFRLIPGMEAQAEIKAGKRRVIEYLLYPLLKALDEAAREP